MNTKKATGIQGETLAARYLERAGYTIVARNWRCALGELDIVAQHGEALVFVEVRTRRADSTEFAFASVGAGKQRKLAALAHTYLAQHALENVLWRIDVIAVALPFRLPPIVEHVQDALNW